MFTSWFPFVAANLTGDCHLIRPHSEEKIPSVGWRSRSRGDLMIIHLVLLSIKKEQYFESILLPICCLNADLPYRGIWGRAGPLGSGSDWWQGWRRKSPYLPTWQPEWQVTADSWTDWVMGWGDWLVVTTMTWYQRVSVLGLIAFCLIVSSRPIDTSCSLTKTQLFTLNKRTHPSAVTFTSSTLQENEREPRRNIPFKHT